MARRKVVNPSRLSPVVTLCVVVAALYLAQDVFVPLVLAMLLSFLLAPGVRLLERRRLGRIPAVLCVVVVAFLAIFSLGWVVAGQVVDVAQNLPQYQGEIERKVRLFRSQGSSLFDRLGQMGREIEQATSDTRPHTGPTTGAVEAETGGPVAVAPPAAELGPPTPASPGSDAVASNGPAPSTRPAGTSADPVYTVPLNPSASPLAMLGEYLGLVLGPLGTGAIVFVFTIFMLHQREDLRDRMIRLISGGNYMATTRALDDAGKRISRYMLAQSVVNGTYGLVVAAGLAVIGLALGDGRPFPSFVLWGLLCALLRFIPYIGPWVAAAFPVALSVAVYPGLGVFVATACLFVVLEIVSNNLMEPWLYGASTGMSTVAVLVSAVFWTWLWGPVGLLLATPLTVCIVVVGKYVPRFRFLDVLLGDQPALPPHVNYYQRLLAGDIREAAAVAVDYAETHGAEEAADAVLVPALRLARRDRQQAGLTNEVESFILQSTTEVLARLAGQAPPTRADNAVPVDTGPADGNGVATGADQPPAAPLVIACPAHHRMEEVLLDMLAMVARDGGVAVRGLSTRTLPSDIEAEIARSRPAVVFVAVLPPGGVAQARYLCRRLRKRFDSLPIVVGYFGRARDFDRLLVRLRAAGASYVTTSLAQSRVQIRALVTDDQVAGPARPVESAAAASGPAFS